MTLLSKIMLGTAAVVAATTICATAALASVTTLGTYGPYKVMADPSTKLCAMVIQNNQGEHVIIAHNGTNHETGIQYGNSKLENLTGRKFDVTFVIDDKEYDWVAEGDGQAVNIISTDTKLPIAMRDANLVGLMVNGTPIFALKSDGEFDAAMNATLACAHRK